MSEESLRSETLVWLTRQPTQYRDKQGKWSVKEVLREHTGTLGELWEEIQATHKDYLYHTW